MTLDLSPQASLDALRRVMRDPGFPVSLSPYEAEPIRTYHRALQTLLSLRQRRAKNTPNEPGTHSSP